MIFVSLLACNCLCVTVCSIICMLVHVSISCCMIVSVFRCPYNLLHFRLRHQVYGFNVFVSVLYVVACIILSLPPAVHVWIYSYICILQFFGTSVGGVVCLFPNDVYMSIFLCSTYFYLNPVWYKVKYSSALEHLSAFSRTRVYYLSTYRSRVKVSDYSSQS